MKKTLLAIAALIVLAACSSDPAPNDKTEEGAAAALSQYVEVAVSGDRSAEEQELYCTELITTQEASYGQCEPPYKYTSNSTWKDLVSVDEVTIDGETATVRWRWSWHGDTQTHTSQDTLYWEDGRWRYQYDL